MAIRVNPINVPALAAYAGNRIGNLGLNFTPPGGFGSGGSGNLASGLAQGLADIQSGMEKKRARADAMAAEKRGFDQKRSLQTDRLQAMERMQKARLKEQKEARAEKFKFEIDKESKRKAAGMSKNKLKKRIAASLTYVNSPEIVESEKKTQQYINGLVKQDVFDELEAKQFSLANPKQRVTQLKAELVTSGQALQQQEKEVNAEPTIYAGDDKILARGQKKGILESDELLDRIVNIKNSYNDQFLKYGGKATGVVSSIAEKAEDLPFGIGDVAGKLAQSMTGLSEGDRDKFLSNQTRFKNQVEQLFQEYRKRITGAQASEKEIAQLRKIFLNTDMSPAQFKSAVNTMITQIQDSKRRKKESLGDPGYSEEDLEYTAKKHGLSKEEVLKKLGVE